MRAIRLKLRACLRIPLFEPPPGREPATCPWASVAKRPEIHEHQYISHLWKAYWDKSISQVVGAQVEFVSCLFCGAYDNIHHGRLRITFDTEGSNSWCQFVAGKEIDCQMSWCSHDSKR